MRAAPRTGVRVLLARGGLDRLHPDVDSRFGHNVGDRMLDPFGRAQVAAHGAQAGMSPCALWNAPHEAGRLLFTHRNEREISMAARIRHIALCVKDIEETAKFYEKAFTYQELNDIYQTNK